MNNLYRFLAFFCMMAWIMPAKAQFTLTTASDITNGTQHYYLIQSIDRPTFYAIPHSDAVDSKVSTTSIPNATMRWCFVNAGSDDDHQYYYIVNSTGRCLYRYDDSDGGIRIMNTYADLSSLSDDELNKYKFYLEQTGSYYFIHPKGASNLYLNKKGTNTDYSNYIKASTYNDSPSVWNFVDVSDVTWPHPFTISTNEDKNYYKFQNVTNTSFYLSKSEEWATVSSTGSNANVWYFLNAGTDATYSNCHYYYIVNASTEKYLYYTGSTDNDVAKVMDYNSTEADKYRFLIVDAAYKHNNNYETCYTIVPKLKQASFSGKDSFAPMAMSDDSHLLLKSDRGTGNYDSHWNIVETDYVAVEAPTITNNYDGTITLSTSTPGATIYYTTNGDTPDNNSTAYSSAFSLGDATVIKAITYLGTDCSGVTTYDVPKYTTPTISFNSSTSEVTITCAGATDIFYTIDGSNPTTSSTAYSAPFTVSSDVTIKAIATHAGYLTSDVATWSNTQHDYSQDYLTFRILTGGTIGWKAYGNLTKTIEYSINNGTWTTWTSTSDGATITVQAGNLVRLKGTAYPYATSKSAYSGFEGGTATYDIEGNIHSLIYGDNFAGTTTMPNNSYMFCSLFKKSNAISAENLILPATELKNYCYRALFSWCTTLTTPPTLPATTLAQGCYWYMFEQSAITTAPELNATTLVQECYGHMFEGCANLNYVKCMATNISATDCKADWLKNVSSTGTFVKESNTTWPSGASGIPSNWTQYNEFLLYSPEINCDGEHITITCATEGASIYYRLNQTGDFSLYSSPLPVNSNTTVEAYSTKDTNTSNIVIITFEIYDNPFDESNRSLDSWTYGNNQVTLPYSVNGIDGHSSNYSKGNHTFETTITLYKLQPTYLWFQHADQSAEIYVDDTYVTTHWGGYNAFFVDITDYVHIGTNRIKVILNNTTRNTLAPAAGDFNFNATLGKVKLFTSPVLPSMDYGYDGFHITSSVTTASATINIKTSIPVGASVTCKIDADDENYHFTDTKASTGEEMTFTTTIPHPHLWNGIEDPFLYNVTLEIYYNNELYHRYERPYGFRYYEYVINEPIGGESYTGFLLNGSPYLLRGVCTHHDLEGKANALDDDDIANDFAIIQELGCNFVRLAHYPHPKEVYDWCDRLGIIVQTEVPCVNRLQSSLPQDYYDHLYIQYEDMVRQHYNHPCIVFWGLSNETTTDDKDFGKTKIEAYTSFIKGLDSERLVGYVMSHSVDDPSGYYNHPNVDWFGCNIYVGWYIDQNSNNPSNRLDTRLTKTLTNKSKPLAFSEYGCGGTPNCHSDDFMTTTTRGNNPRHDIEYQMWLHEGHIAAIKNYPQLLFTSQWQLFDIAVSSRQEGYTVCIDGEHTSTDDNLRYLNNKGLVERDHKTKKDPFYLYKAWWNQKDKFVHICGKDYEKLTGRVIKCYTNDGSELTLYVNNVAIQTVPVVDNIATFTARNFNPGDVIRVDGATTHDAFSLTNDFITDGNWNMPANWRGNAVPAAGSHVVVRAECTIPNEVVAQANSITIGENGSLTIADGGQLVSNSAVNATVEKNIAAYTVSQNQGESLTNGWYFIASPITEDYSPTGSMVANTYDLYRLNNTTWENFKNSEHSDFTSLVNGQGYLYANSGNNNQGVTLTFTGNTKPYDATYGITLNEGFNLVGNPYTFDAYVNRPYYKMNAARTAVEAVSDNAAIAPCTGVVVDYTDGQNAVFTAAPAQSQSSNGGLNIALSQVVEPVEMPAREGNGLKVGPSTGSGTLTLDNAIVNFNEDSQLGKFYFGTQNANIYIPQNGQEFAIVSAETQGEMPVNFKANENGTYTITVNAEDVEMGYLHLIDNMTGADVDLLHPNAVIAGEDPQSPKPSYTFTARTTDYESRFRLVFVCADANDSNGTFAFINNGNIIITADVEGATLQVIDVMGRILISRDAKHCVSTSGFAPGVYVLRLIQGGKVRTQKIVID